ncbi:MAG TPA: hypothetical protein DD670_14720, partial [Planctomycetaceae bacterium]|nr:hypothetical protein [Planctomycetaceae bacterium]
QDWTFDIFFPAPKITRRFPNYGNTQWWLYARGEYGGGSWTVFDSVTTEINQLDYNDLRCSLGLEFNRMDRIGGLIEVGVAFERELVQRWPWETFDPSTTVFLRAGLVR